MLQKAPTGQTDRPRITEYKIIASQNTIESDRKGCTVWRERLKKAVDQVDQVDERIKKLMEKIEKIKVDKPELGEWK